MASTLRRPAPRLALHALAAALLLASLPVRTPANGGAQLPRSSPEAQGIASSALLAFIEAADAGIDAMHSVMIVRHGRVVAEGWWAPYDARTPHVLYSLSKSFTSTAVGLAAADGKLSVDDEVLKFFPEEAPAEPPANLKAMRVRDLLRMNTGHQTEAQLWRAAPDAPSRTWTKTFLEHPVPFKPGTHFLYNSPGTYMLSAIVQKVTGATVLDYLTPRLFEPLAIEKPAWVASPQGITAGAYGMLARTEDIAKFGQLYLQKGTWNGRQIVPAAWVAEATALQTSNGSSPSSDWDQGYGYQFWRSLHGTYRGDGAFGQYCLVLPEADAVVAITSGVRNMQQVMNLVWERLLPAMKAEALPADAAGERALRAKLSSLVMTRPSGAATAPAVAKAASGKWFAFPANDRGIEAIALEFGDGAAALRVRTSAGESRTPVGLGGWAKSRGGFANGMDAFLSVPAEPLKAAAGAWTSGDTFTVKLVLHETPFYSTLSFRFDGDRLIFDSEHHVSFGPREQAQLVGTAM